MKCFQAKAGQIGRQWYVVDAKGIVVGRLAAQVASILMGKHRPTYTAHIDTGDYVIITNVDQVVFTGSKWKQKTYRRHTGYPGGRIDEPAWKLFQRQPERILEEAIRRMMPKSKMGRQMMAKLKLYVGPNHPHVAQQPLPLEPIAGRPVAAGAVLAVKQPKRRPSQPENEGLRSKPEVSEPALEETGEGYSSPMEATAPAPDQEEASSSYSSPMEATSDAPEEERRAGE